jgi:putative transposase
MPGKEPPPAAKPDAIVPDVPDEWLEKLSPGPMDAAGVEAVFQKLKKAVIERALAAELGVHLASPEGGRGNHDNGKSGKTVLTDAGPLRIDVPCDRVGSGRGDQADRHRAQRGGRRSRAGCV